MDFSWTEEQEIWRRTVREFAQKKIKPKVRDIDTNKKIPEEIIKDMAKLGLLAPTVSKKYDMKLTRVYRFPFSFPHKPRRRQRLSGPRRVGDLIDH